MKSINTKEFVSYTIVGRGWTVTISRFSTAKDQWDGMFGPAMFYGNREDGTKELIDEC